MTNHTPETHTGTRPGYIGIPQPYPPKLNPCTHCRSSHIGDAGACACPEPCDVKWCPAREDGTDPFAPRILPATQGEPR